MKELLQKGSLIILIALIIGSGCSEKKESEPKLSVKADFVVYTDVLPSAYTVDQDGLVYTATEAYKDESTELTVSIDCYDLEGKLTASFSLVNSLYSSVQAMAVKENIIFLTALESSIEGDYSILYSFDMQTNKLTKLCELPFVEEIKQIIYLDQRVYILSNRLICYSLTDLKTYELGVELPVSMALMENSTLMIQSSASDGGYKLLNYSPKTDSLTAITQFKKGKFENFAMSSNGKQVMYTYNQNPRGLVMSPVNSLEEEAELYPEAVSYNYRFGIYNIKGQVYCITNSLSLIRFSLDVYQQQNRALRYISAGYQADEPFGCGYAMKRTELEEDKFALKVLAQDKDYDMCLMNSESYFSYNIKKNGVFYPLNEVKGIKEYLDACYPYVKDAATDEDGNIWMIPVGVDIPGWLVNVNNLEQEKLALKNNMTYEEFYRIINGITEEQKKKTAYNATVIYMNFISQNFRQSADLSRVDYTQTLKLFQQYDFKMPQIINAFDISDLRDNILFAHTKQAASYENYLQQFMGDEELEVYSMPKQRIEDPNFGSCTFLAVNSRSKYPKEVFSYLEELIAYLSSKEPVPLFFKAKDTNANMLRKSLDKLYENGEIVFNIDKDVYSESLFQVIEQGSSIADFIDETQRKLDTYFKE